MHKSHYQLQQYISYKFIKILKASFHKFLVLISFKNSKNGTIKYAKKTCNYSG